VKKSSSPTEGGFHLNIITASQQAAFAVLGSVIYTPKINNLLRDLGQLFAGYRAIKSRPRGKHRPVLRLMARWFKAAVLVGNQPASLFVFSVNNRGIWDSFWQHKSISTYWAQATGRPKI
jgi:hypothetical protein